jgi:hypothetical protein
MGRLSPEDVKTNFSRMKDFELHSRIGSFQAELARQKELGSRRRSTGVTKRAVRICTDILTDRSNKN